MQAVEGSRGHVSPVRPADWTRSAPQEEDTVRQSASRWLKASSTTTHTVSMSVSLIIHTVSASLRRSTCLSVGISRCVSVCVGVDIGTLGDTEDINGTLTERCHVKVEGGLFIFTQLVCLFLLNMCVSVTS